ncbi:MAG: VCBS repeat-containing protein [Balneolaceae bacterium]|nr:VCBS repeat-containing protein [Balneolaceae bacterium]MBO6544832.1 VCBS repeat-containing protein [Balneolaceae bacterium]MBO6646228.1 VCBS repeat-containing protein [Balneolaceae bacterium]
MQRTHCSIITFFCIVILWGCNAIPERSWVRLIPEESTFLIVPKAGVELSDISQTEYAPILDDLTPTALQQVLEIDSMITQNLDLKALVLYPAASTESQFLWISETEQEIEEWVSAFYEPFEQNNYSFSGINIHKINIREYQLFVAQIHDWLVASPSSRAVENSLRAYSGISRSMEVESEPTPGQLIVNSEHLDHWVQQFTQVTFRPSVMGAFTGVHPTSLSYTPSENTNPAFDFTGTLDLKDTTRSELIQALTSENRTITLDRFIASNAAAFGIFRLQPKLIPKNLDGTLSRIDSLLISDSDTYRDLALATDHEFAVVTFPESGLLATGEYLFLRKLQSVNAFRNNIEGFAEQGLIEKTGNSYYIQSEILAQLVGSELIPFTDFYLSFSRDVAIISKRRGLSESVESDRNRRRVIYYNETYSTSRRNMPSDISGFVWSYTNDFLKFIEPYLMPRTTLTGLIGQYDITAMSFSRVPNSNSVNFNFKSITEEGSTQPYDELWVLPISGEELSGTPVLANIVGSSTEEIIFSTRAGNVRALAFDGTVVMNANTNGDVPVGSPVLYDWYGNGQPIILLAAGTKIYAWNEGGNLLPQFPLEIGERISAPIVVTDVLRNGIPEIIVATENRRIHVLDGRGQNVRGWPQFTNTIVNATPVFTEVDGTWSIWAYSQNILHSWLRSGGIRPGYPTFTNASFTSSPYIFENQVLGSATDGYVYSIGKQPSFKDSLAISIQMDSISIKSVYATNNQLTSFSVEPNVLLRDSVRFYRSDLYVTQSANGSIFMFNPIGELKVTHSLGQPASNTMAPQIIDINGDGDMELVALADFGRLFAWEILTDRRIFNIPTSGMKYPIIADLNGDGQKELIAQTREGLRCWTINKIEE